MIAHDLDQARAKLAENMKIDILNLTQEDENVKARHEVSRTFVSDTITVPTPEMFVYALKTSLGDDVYTEPSTLLLQEHMARLTGKEAALFLPSGTMSNQVGLRTHLTQPPYSIVCDHRAHIHKYEAGGCAFHSGAHVVAAVPRNGHHLTLDDVKSNVMISDDVHFAPTTVIALENTLNGTIIPQDEVIAISDYAHSQGMKMHLDGARIWHVAAETATPLAELCAPFDSVSLCFSKGLGAPVGSCLVGTKAFITQAKRFRKLFGGGMRQTGVLAGAAAYAVTNNFPLLPKVHALAKELEVGLRELGCEILSEAETCMVFFDPAPIGVEYDELILRAAALPDPIKLFGSRLVCHIQTSPAAVQDLLELVRTIADEKKAAGFVPKPVTNGTNGTTRPTYRDIYVRKPHLAKGEESTEASKA
ncbi:hypothetical protein SCHPADRAFT_934286 [Schizopora paradoxa]|uniref:Aromatic amino acid beta-eliminating lyase/threonine aldolase domain-containing protein n=1 Tax=Schizopora paradoxa TaxID=27342 RepID=A0A0H2S9D3_9AGAM|nr:hypothetical protein SCHPADRAFT_934286 [Schizopora paradoxa]